MISTQDNMLPHQLETRKPDDIVSVINVLRQVSFFFVQTLYYFCQVDEILTQLSVFWSNTDVILDSLAKKGQHIETFISYTRNPQLLGRFRERIVEYRYYLSSSL
jgi:hypothetical protein